jgi:adenosylcobinamide-GDP ribazoletransferase
MAWIAAFIFFTRLPLGRIGALRLPGEAFARAIHYWAAVGWLTGGVMAGVLWLSAQLFPYAIAVALALLSRLLLTGAMHEDGLADFVDGFGGGQTRERILEIMKDSRIGTYGATGLIFYFLLIYLLLLHLPLATACAAILAADPFCKFTGSLLCTLLPYARKAGESKAGFVSERMTPKALLVAAFFGLVPLLLLPQPYLPLFPIVTYLCLLRLLRRKIGGYTGDCCGATFLLCELSLYLGAVLFAGLP